MSVEAHKSTHQFQAEVNQLLNLMIHSLYSNKEIFLRELISNASDALDKLRFSALQDDALYEDDGDLKIQVDFDKDAKTITIRDNGIGMSEEEIIKHLGTIAKSGTKEFIQSLSGDQAKDSQLIGQFGVGFYSAFIVADKVTVCSRKAGSPADKAVFWESRSDEQSQFSIEHIEKKTRGTEVTLHLKDDAAEFLDAYRLRNIIRTYSDHISFSVEMKKETPVEPESESNDEIVIEAEPQYEVVNRATALWMCNKNELKDEEYQEFYKHLSHDFEDPLAWTHSRVEGRLEYTNLLYIPKRAPFDLYNREHKRGVKLYVKRVFIMDDAEQFIPNYLRFVKGLIDSNDLPLNVSREILQRNKTVDSIRQACIKKILGLLEDMVKNDREKYEIFWQQFGQVLKEGPGEDHANSERIAGLLRFASTYNDTDAQNVTFEDYISRMKEGQEKIYFLTAESYITAKNSPHLEIFRKKGIEVLLMFDRVDEWLVSNLHEFSGKSLQSIAKGALDMNKLEDEETLKHQKEEDEKYKSFVEKLKAALEEKVKEVRVSHRLTDSACCIVVEQHELNMQMQRLLQSTGQHFPMSKPILEINPEHALIRHLHDESNEAYFKELAHLILDQAILSEGGQLDDPSSFVKRMNALFVEMSSAR